MAIKTGEKKNEKTGGKKEEVEEKMEIVRRTNNKDGSSDSGLGV